MQFRFAVTTVPVPEIRDLVQSGESETTEFKERWSDHSALRELAAFANTRGGTLIVGVTDDGEVAGWTGSDLDALASKITDSLRLHPTELRTAEVDGEEVLVVSVSEAQTPIAYRGRYYHRVGATTREVPPGKLTRFLMERTGETWDATPTDKKLEAIDGSQIEHFAELAQDRLPHVSASADAEDVLRKLNLIQDKKLTRAALLLFGADPQSSSFSARVHMGRFKDAVTIVDDKWFGGTLFEQVEAVMNQFRQYLQVRYDISMSGRGGEGNEGAEGMQRREVWDYPLTALEEAVINALIHRDYGRLGNVEVRVFDDRVVVSNPGGLPKPLTVDELQREGHDSIRRNPLLAQTFYFASLVEQWGTGTIRMAQACEAQGLPTPALESSDDRFKVSFSKDPYTEERLKELGLSERQRLIVRQVKEAGSIDNAKVRELTGVSERTALRDLSALEEVGVVRRVQQTGRGTRYELVENPPNPPGSRHKPDSTNTGGN